MKTLVQFDVGGSPEFPSLQDYTSLGIKLCFNGKKLTALQVAVEKGDEASHEEVVAHAREKIGALLALIEFGRGLPLRLEMVHTEDFHSEMGGQAISGADQANDSFASARIPLPPAGTVVEVSASVETRLQLIWYNRAKDSDWVVDKIRSYYAVLEIEEETEETRPPGATWQEMKWLRHAVSHPRLRGAEVKNYLRQQIQADCVDLNDERHLQFLSRKLEILHQEARSILEQKLPKWW